VDKPKEVINSEKTILEMQTKVVRLFHALSDKNFNDEVIGFGQPEAEEKA